MKFQKYIERLPLSNIFKEQILDKNFINNNPKYYQNYPSLFLKTFFIQKKDVQLLDIAGFLYYKATILIDSLIDEKDLSKIAQITICQEESIKILTSIFGLENRFWLLFNIRREEYFKAIILEKELLNKSVISFEEYSTLADFKSAFGKIAIDCLYSLDTKNKVIYEKLLLSHKYFSVAFQLSDDIQDLKNDLTKEQFNWAVYLIKKEGIGNLTPEILEKHLYLKGISNEIYKKGIDYCNKALSILEEIKVPEWKNVINETKSNFQTAIVQYNIYIETLTSEITLSNKIYIENNLKKSVSLSINFIKTKQNENGSWRDYINQGGISDIWTTAFILSKISENNNLKLIFEEEISKAITFINKNTISKLWGYNTTWIDDADSTNLVFLSFFLNNKKIETELFSEWLNFQKVNGGFSTYSNKLELLNALNDKKLSNVNGWLSVHDCVSAVSLYFLAKYNLDSKNFIKLKKYFDKKSIDNISTYWWTNKVYTLYYLAKTYSLLGDTIKLNVIIDEITSNQNSNGSFSDKYGENLFYTGLSLDIILLDQRKNKTLNLNKTVSYLLNNQFTDGSWENSNALQVPDSADIKASTNYFPIAQNGINVRAKEFNRLFTTTTILQSLVNYEQKYNTINF